MSFLVNPYRFGAPPPGFVYVGGMVASSADGGDVGPIAYTLTGGTDSTPQPGDIVVVTCAKGVNGSGQSSVSGFTLLAGPYNQGGTGRISMSVYAKTMPNPADSTIEFIGGGGSTTSVAWTVMVFRNITTTLDVTTTTLQGSGATLDPPAITPVTPGTLVVVCAARQNSTNYWQGAGLTNFLQRGQSDSWPSSAFIGFKLWDGSGAYDETAITTGSGGSNNYVIAVLALKP